MAAKILEERPEEENVETTDINEVQEAVEEQPTEAPPPEDDLPEKYRGKTAAELARMHQEAEKLLGRQSSEVGELRKVVDSYIQTQLSQQQQQEAPQEDDDVDFFVYPDKAVARAIERHPRIL